MSTPAPVQEPTEQEKLLQAANEYGELFFGAEKLARLLGETPEAISLALDTPDSPLGRAIDFARLRSEAEFRKAVVKAAKQGSSPAQEMVRQFLQQMDR